jgi:hypothetical protein
MSNWALGQVRVRIIDPADPAAQSPPRGERNTSGRTKAPPTIARPVTSKLQRWPNCCWESSPQTEGGSTGPTGRHQRTRWDRHGCSSAWEHRGDEQVANQLNCSRNRPNW